MTNITTFSGQNPLTLRIQGTGEYVRNILLNLENEFAEAENERLESIRQDYE